MRQVSTSLIARFHTWPDNSPSGEGYLETEVTAPFRIVGFSSAKGFGAPAGSFSMTLKPFDGADVLDLWEEPEGVWVQVTENLNGTYFDLWLGIIDTCTKRVERVSGGARIATFTVTGRGFGKVFAETTIFSNIYTRGAGLPVNIAAESAFIEHDGSYQFTPAVRVLDIMRIWLGNNGQADAQWLFPPSLYNGRSFFDVLNKSTVDTTVRGNSQDLTGFPVDPHGTPLWDTITGFTNPVLNEFWPDLAPDPRRDAADLPGDTPVDPVTGRDIPLPSVLGLLPSIYLRERPFPSSEFGELKWNRLPTHEIDENQIASVTMAKGNSAERFNYWTLLAESAQGQIIDIDQQVNASADSAVVGDGSIGNPGSIPVWDATSIRRYGLRIYRQSSLYFPLNDHDIGKLVLGMVPRWLRLLYDWYAVSPKEISGSLTTAYLMGWIRVGHRVRITEEDGTQTIFYVEAVNHQYQYPQGGKTTLTLTRGERIRPGEETLLAKLYARFHSEEPSVGSEEHAVVGGSATLTEEQRSALAELPAGVAGALEGLGPLVDPRAVEAAQSGVPDLATPGGTLAERGEPFPDPSMSFGDVSPSTSPDTTVEGIDDINNPPEDPSLSADPYAGIEDEPVNPNTVTDVGEITVISAGASIPED